VLSALTDVFVSSWRVKFFVTFLISKVGHFTLYSHLSLHFGFGFCVEADADWFGLFTFCIVLNVHLIVLFVVIMYIKTYVNRYRAL
jgi:hypothetical protein